MEQTINKPQTYNYKNAICRFLTNGSIYQKLFIFIILLLLAYLCYYPGLSGTFIFDDEVNLSKNPDFVLVDNSWQAILAASFSSDSGPLKRPVAMFTFVLNQIFNGINNTYAYKFTNIIIHGFNGFLVYLLLFKVFCNYQLNHQTNNENKSIYGFSHHYLALIIAIIWLVHPLNLTSVLYIIQRMVSLSASFALISCLCYVYAREKMQSSNRKIGLFIIFAPGVLSYILAILSKESALITPLLIFIIELVVFKGNKFNQEKYLVNSNSENKQISPNNRDLAIIRLWQVVITLIILVSIYFFATRFAAVVDSYINRHFSMSERLLSEARIIFRYIGLIFYPLNSHLGLYHDDVELSSSLFQPISTFYSVATWLVLAIIALIKIRQYPVIIGLIAWFVIGHLLESTFWPLELMHEHRNYLPMLSLIILFVLGFIRLANKIQIKSVLIKFIFFIIIAVLIFSTHLRALYWGDSVIHANFEAQHHPNSPRANYEVARALYILYLNKHQENLYLATLKYLDKSNSLPRAGAEQGCFGKFYIVYSNKHELSKEEFDWCLQRIKTSPSLDINLSKFDFILKSKTNGDISISNENIEMILQALINNKFLLNHHKAIISSMLGTYYANVLNDYENSSKYLVAALELDPQNITIYKTWISYLIATNNFTAAENAIKSVEQHYLSWQYYNTLNPLKNMIKEKKLSGKS